MCGDRRRLSTAPLLFAAAAAVGGGGGDWTCSSLVFVLHFQTFFFSFYFGEVLLLALKPRKGSFPKKERKIPLLEPISKMPIYNQQIIEIMILFCNVFLENKKKNIVDKKKSIKSRIESHGSIILLPKAH